MSNQNFPDISVGDFAIDILKDMAKDPVKALKPALKESTIQSSDAPDISNVEVSNDFVTLVTEGKKVKTNKTHKWVLCDEKNELSYENQKLMFFVKDFKPKNGGKRVGAGRKKKSLDTNGDNTIKE